MIKKEDCAELGYISKAHGIKGELKAAFDVYDLNEYRAQSRLFLSKKNAPLTPFRVISLKPAGKFVNIKLDGIERRDDAEQLIGSTIYLPLTELPKLSDGHFYYFEIIGFTVVDERDGELGTITSFTDTTGQDLLFMDYQGHEILLPATDHTVLRADKEEQKLYTRLPEGLLALYMDSSEGDDKEDDEDE